MIEPDFPKNESERINDLLATNLLDSPKENDFDNITELASSIFGMPISAITLIDKERQWFKSCIGLPKEVTETPRAISFCGHTINNPNKVTVITDARLDERFQDNPLVANGTIVFYAGAPLMNKNNNALGTLCIIHSSPRTFNAKETKTLQILANQISKLIELRLINIQLDKSLQEKVVLLKEIHHRVKNNLQLVSSLLNLQKNKLNDDQFSKAIQTSQNRIKSIAIVHEKLYKSESLSLVDIESYLRDLVTEISTNLMDPERFQFNLEIQKIELTIDQILPLGLILNELISNSIKHCKKNNEVIVINISLKSENHYLLKYNDNGLGMENNTSLTEGIGLELIQSFVDQLEGKLDSFSNKNGLFYEIQFKPSLKFLQ
jgi:two-component sensor histidine kinase